MWATTTATMRGSSQAGRGQSRSGVHRVIVTLPSSKESEVLKVLDAVSKRLMDWLQALGRREIRMARTKLYSAD